MAKFGETLKREREMRKISLREVSEATKIGLRYLEALEENRFDQLPGGLFNKGFIRAYARFIGLDGETLVNSYLYDIAHLQKSDPSRPRFVGVEQEESPLPAIAARMTPKPRRHLPIGLAVGAAAGLMLAAAGAWLILSRLPAGAASAARKHVQTTEPPTHEAGLLHPSVPEAQPAQASSAPLESLSSEAENQPVDSQTAPAPPTVSDKRDDRKSERAERSNPPPAKDMVLFIGTSQPTEIAVRCDGVEKVKRELAAFETIAVSCQGEVLLSATNAGALSLKVNGRECLPLGEMGAALVDFPINAERAEEICPLDKEAP